MKEKTKNASKNVSRNTSRNASRNMSGNTSKPKYNMAQNTWFMIRLAWTSKEKKVLVLSFLAAALAVALNLINLYVSPAILSVVERQAGVSTLMLTILAFVLMLMVVSAAAAYVDRNIICGRISVRCELLTMLNKKAATTSYPNLFHDKYQKLSAKSQEAISSNGEATEAIWTTLTDLLTNLVGFVFYLILLSSVQPFLMLVVLATTGISYAVSNSLNTWGYRHREEEAEYEKQMNYLTRNARDLTAAKEGSYYAKYAGSQNLGNRLFFFFGWLGYSKELAMDMRMYRQDKICDKYNRNKEGPFASNGLFAHLAWGPIGLCAATASAVSVLFTGVVYAFVCLKALAGAFGLGAVTQYVSSITKVSTGMSSFLAAFGSMRNNAPFLEMTYEFLDIPNEMYQGSLTVEKRRDRKYQVEFCNVSFRYPGSENWSLRNVNMKFEIGKRLAVVGMNGSGKTTFIKLLCRLYDPTEGAILLNGIDIRKYNYREYMDIFSVVFQDFKLFALKLGENVAEMMEWRFPAARHKRLP